MTVVIAQTEVNGGLLRGNWRIIPGCLLVFGKERKMNNDKNKELLEDLLLESQEAY